MRILSLCALLAVAVAVLAGAGLGSTTRSPRATAPRLIAHDTTAFRSATEDAPLRGGLRHGPAKLAGPRIYADSVLSASTVTNPTIDVSRTQLVVAQNGTYSIRSRTHALLGQTSAQTFWANIGGLDAAGLCATDPQGEPAVAYDWAADRWVITEAAYALDANAKPTGAYVQCVAVSTSPDATGTWSRYVFQVSTTRYADRPQVGVWSDGYYVSFNQLTADAGFDGAGALALERSKMLTGAAAQARYFDLSGVTPRLGGMLPATIVGPNAPLSNAVEPYLQMHDDPLDINDRLEVWGFHVDWTAPITNSTFQPVRNIPLNTGGYVYDNLFSCAKPGTTTSWSSCLFEKVAGGTPLPLDALATVYHDTSDVLPQLGGRLQWMRAAGGTESLSAAVTVNAGSDEADPAWFRLQDAGAGWTIGARGIVDAGDTSSRYLPSAAFDNSGNVAVGYVKTDGTQYLGTAYTDATAGSFAEATVDAGTSTFTNASTVFGGQTMLALDPVDYCTMWFAGPLPSGGVSYDDLTVGTCTASTTQPPLLTADPTWTAALVREGLTITGNVATFTGGTSTTYQWRLCDVNGFNCVDIAGQTGTTHVMSAADASGTHTLRFMQIATNANGSSKAVTTATTLVQSIPPVNTVLPAISGTATAGQVLSTTNGTWTSSSPVSYTYRWRRCSAGVCANIGGANSSSYTLASADVGSTVDVVVSATNTGGGTDANAAATTAVAAAPVVSSGSGGSSSAGGSSSSGGSSSGGGGGGGGGGGAGSPNLKVTGFASATAPKVGDEVMFALAVSDANLKPAQSLNLAVTLGAGLQFEHGTTDRGNGCALTNGALTCNLDWLSGDAPQANVQLYAKVTGDTGRTLTAVASSAQGVSSATDATLALSLDAAATTTTSGTGTTAIPGGLNSGGSTGSTTVADRKKPSARALASAGARGRAAKLKFRIYDDRGVAKATVTVKRNGKAVGTARSGFGPVAFGSTYYLGWQVPKRASKGTYTFCVVAYDRAANHSPSSCAALSVQ